MPYRILKMLKLISYVIFIIIILAKGIEMFRNSGILSVVQNLGYTGSSSDLILHPFKAVDNIFDNQMNQILSNY